MDQPIAEAALRLVGAVPEKKRTEYKAACESLGAYLRRSGLARTLAFLRAKGEAQGLLAEHLEEQFRGLVLPPKIDLMSAHLAANLDVYRVHVEVAQRIALWHKRMAQSLIRDKSGAGETV